MDVVLGNGTKKKNLIEKTFERCKSFAIGMKKKGGSTSYVLPRKSKSMPCVSLSSSSKEEIESSSCTNIKKRRVTPEGCFSVYVGAEKQRFVIRTIYVNHPLFKILLEEAESEYGYNSEGPLVLPCQVSLFVKVLAQMDSEDENDNEIQCGNRYPCSPYHLLSSPRAIAANQF
ncbi:hypothetical protein Leryth_004573 [Lithospermum erythrorhizon]|nr:hypothetical protein Leryth_004573 [Lithospermum erythrorhizon]